jgi:hypothetical protein
MIIMMLMMMMMIIIIISAMAAQNTTTPFRILQPLSMNFTQGISRVESIKRHVQIYQQIYYNSIMKGTSVKPRNTGITAVLRLVLITYGTEISYHYGLFINIPACHVTRLARTKARKLLLTRTQLGLASLPLAFLTHKTDMLSIYCYCRKFQSISFDYKTSE